MSPVSPFDVAPAVQRRITKRERFLALMEQAMPWAWLIDTVEPHWRPPAVPVAHALRLEPLLRLHFVQHWFALDDGALEDALHDSASLRRFVGLDLGRLDRPLAASVREFRERLQAERLARVLLTGATLHLHRQSLRLRCGAVREPGLFSAPD